MVNSNILKISALFFLTRKPAIVPRTLTTAQILYKGGARPKTPKIEKKLEVKKEIKQEKKIQQKGNYNNYYNFLCKCGAGFDTFSEFLDHLKVSHQIKNPNFSEILAKKDGSKWSIKFYWGLSCQCGNSFSSSLCNADLKVNNKQIELLKRYQLQCLKCKKYAKFNKEELLDEFLKERVKQRLIYSFYNKEFDKFKNDKDSKKELENHIQELCEKCQLLGRFCGERW